MAAGLQKDTIFEKNHILFCFLSSLLYFTNNKAYWLKYFPLRLEKPTIHSQPRNFFKLFILQNIYLYSEILSTIPSFNIQKLSFVNGYVSWARSWNQNEIYVRKICWLLCSRLQKIESKNLSSCIQKTFILFHFCTLISQIKSNRLRPTQTL